VENLRRALMLRLLRLFHKKAGAAEIKDFCPISLVSGVYNFEGFG
jgi:hypothetical protein